MMLESFIKAFLIHLKASFIRQFQRKFDGEPKGVVQSERAFSVDHIACREIRRNLFEFL